MQRTLARSLWATRTVERLRQRQVQRANPESQMRNERPNDRKRDRTSANVPGISQVLPGKAVSIVLKADQRTGREVQGVIQDVLTRGNHPRGMKVRLQDGRVGRVQRMASAGEVSAATQAERWPVSSPTQESARSARGGRWQREDDSQMPPARSLADFIPALEEQQSTGKQSDQPTFATATAKCPICNNFEGDETAVSHHVEQHFD